MYIKIKLLDEHYCNGCPLLDISFGFRCKLLKEEVKINYEEGLITRPDKCVLKNGR